MREILFRGKTEQGEWVYGCFINSVVKNGVFGYITGNKVVEPIKILRKTVGQFTGLTDKNGKKIFEGDIVKTKFGRLCVVEWRSTQCFCGFDFTVCICNANNKTKAPSEFDLYFPENLEIIGNIFDNRELLGE